MASPSLAGTVRAEDYRAFWLWAGVKPQPALEQSDELYLLAGEVTEDAKPHIVAQRSATPKVKGPRLWIVYRAQTINWDDAVIAEILRRLQTWEKAGNAMVGLQIDFDVGTKHLEHYAEFLRGVRARLPRKYKLGVTGLLDWSANGDPQGLAALAGVVDEMVLQIYQGRQVIPGYAGYLSRLGDLHVPFRMGLLQGGEWTPPEALASNPFFKGYVVFLLNDR
jgi:hypothetical protein